MESEGQITIKSAEAMRRFHGLLDSYRAKFTAEPQKMDQHVTQLLKEIDYESEIERQAKDPVSLQGKQNSVAEFVQSIQEYLRRAETPTLVNFLAGVVLEGRDEEPDKETQAAQEAVKLLTLHSAKGLEFPRVYLVGMEEGLLPHKRSVDDELITVGSASIEEERRLAYVGITRAKDHLTLTRAATRKKWGKVKQSLPSRFLSEMTAKDRKSP